MKKKSIRDIFANLFLIQIGIIAGFLLLELPARFIWSDQYIHHYSDIVDVTHVPRPFVMFAGKPNYEEHNFLGYKGELPSTEKPENEFRIFVLGGSTVYNGAQAAGYPPPYSIPKTLENIINENPHKMTIKVFNYGVVSSNTAQDFVRLMVDVIDYSPDLVIFYGGANDFLNPETRPGYPHRFIMYENNPLWSNFHDFPLLDSLLMSSAILRKISYPYLNKKYTQPVYNFNNTPPAEEYYLTHLQSYIDNTLKAHKLLSHLKVPFVTVIQPVLSSKEHVTEEEYALNQRPCKDCFIRFFSQAKKAFDKAGVTYIDASDVFDGVKKSIYLDACHLIDGEDRKPIAQIIYKNLTEKSILPQ